MCGWAVFPFHQKFVTDFNDIHSLKIVAECPDHLGEQRITGDNKKSLDTHKSSHNEQAN